jgi:predicted acetyltransferase
MDLVEFLPISEQRALVWNEWLPGALLCGLLFIPGISKEVGERMHRGWDNRGPPAEIRSVRSELALLLIEACSIGKRVVKRSHPEQYYRENLCCSSKKKVICMQVTLSLANEKEMSAVKHFFLSYFYDMSQYDDQLIINEAGLPMWKPFGLPGPQTTAEFVTFNWWVRDTCLSYLIRVEGNPAGFVIICPDKKHLPKGVDYELMDFYIAPKYRRQGIGRRAASKVLDLYRGEWVVYQLEKNIPARRFWQAVVAEYTRGQYENLDDGTQQRFTNKEQ